MSDESPVLALQGRALVLTIHPGVVYNVFEAVDVITLIRGGVYDDLSLSVGEVLKKRSPVCYITSFTL